LRRKFSSPISSNKKERKGYRGPEEKVEVSPGEDQDRDNVLLLEEGRVTSGAPDWEADLAQDLDPIPDNSQVIIAGKRKRRGKVEDQVRSRDSRAQVVVVETWGTKRRMLRMDLMMGLAGFSE
jgi:hypothetical protein